MAGRWTFVGIFAVLGFVGGIVANWGYKQLEPALMEIFKDVTLTDTLLSGIGGALLTVLIVLIWANFSEK